MTLTCDAAVEARDRLVVEDEIIGGMGANAADVSVEDVGRRGLFAGDALDDDMKPHELHGRCRLGGDERIDVFRQRDTGLTEVFASRHGGEV